MSPHRLGFNEAAVFIREAPTFTNTRLQEICYLDQVLDAASGTPTNGGILVDGNAPSVSVSAADPAGQLPPVVVEGQRQTTFLAREDTSGRSNGHAAGEEPACGGAKFELRAFQEERRPAKLFTPGDELQVRVTRRRPTEEVPPSVTGNGELSVFMVQRPAI